MVVSLYLLFEVLAVIFCLHYLYDETVRFDAPTIVLILVELLWMNAMYQLEWNQGLSLLIYPMIMIYCGIKFGFDIKKLIVNNVLCLILLAALQATITLLVYVVNHKSVMDIYEMIFINCTMCLIAKWGLKRCKLEKLSKVFQSNEMLIWASMAVILVSTVTLVVNYKQEKRFGDLFYTILVVSIILIIIAIIDIGKHKVRVKEFEAELRLHKLYEKSFQNLIDDICARQHEFDNHINTIYSQHFLHKTYDELVDAQRKYCKSIVEMNHFNKLLSKGNPIILGFLYGKLSEAEKLGIDVTYKVNIGQLESAVPVHKIVELLGNLLNNAIEALEKDKDINKLKLVMIENPYEIAINVSNECKDIGYNDISDFFKKGYSRKGENRGYGLYNVKKTCDEYGAVLETVLDDEEGSKWVRFMVIINKGI
ncbi:MAG: GHKL domain-containing protein [Lachnospiraceae bacterium]|nr:GHKL domain-containing protein [Lachnospiraceae bacterium]